ncbi:phospholipid/cholesterol/gamma-HCH transport system permease protein [Fibrobacter sp. UWCM]|jgi:phospholipid/cholesterol/gamma-HCH transport system permease protein|uniref:MlaE family ABC transporter permease n=1 Tax=unclassified Fibrobacter TaxID=2634177 RepID=UPI0009199747|nr:MULTISPECIES: ABC transporter permease [unclassified Fibrobacter]SHG98305.1 phospholipid/cholesterol/gamma-HCH transport system permease protein [Fibrobacter sp. UWCM]
MEVQTNDKKLTLVGQKFHALGLFLLRRPVGQEIALFVRAIMSLFNKSRSFKTDSRNIILQTFFTGVEIFPILFVVATLFGTVVIIEVITMMGKMGFDDVVGGLMVVVIIRELGPILTAFLIAGRSGSSLTTYIGGMVINSEVDALATMGVDPVRYLVMPGLIGGAIATFIMNIVFSTSAICAGYLMTKIAIALTGNALNLQLTWDYLSTEILKALTFTDFIFIVVKPIVFGCIITTNACYQAMNIPRDIRQVPKATGRSVIKSFFYIVCADVFLSLFYFIDYFNEISKII